MHNEKDGGGEKKKGGRGGRTPIKDGREREGGWESVRVQSNRNGESCSNLSKITSMLVLVLNNYKQASFNVV